MASGVAFLVSALVIAAGALLYFLPAFVAVARSHQSGLAILILNGLLGWSFIGWVVALVWACTKVTQPVSPGTGRGFSNPRMGVAIVVAVAGVCALAVFAILTMLSSTPPAPFIYTLE
jgi:Superinfection immunity protein